ncbi:MAG: acetyl-CoA carboxylase carboxyltransferase subunit alpha [Gammaproteobacteria bacterium]|nr:acetyl-CoA carboxylase carboxyltransferase subunit alpha [Gammaproteobacteria bacterium]MBL6819033.1 acetyl-CoA carboxylase carboxyltransferase subunit alpha [Gammaproteobacteria bacterium]MBL6899131.1 acetyl-CoA carboxylase carboxyltransferase subunit alpha [Gammaproteobacteria bacterium]
MSEYNPNYLDFEQPLLEIENKITTIETSANASQKDIKKIESLKIDLDKNISKIFSSLSDWQISQIARHPLRPYTLDYIRDMFTDFVEIHGDRMFGDDKAIICGFATLENESFMLIGHQKGRDSKEKVYRNFGMPKPEGYRKALRAMKLAEKFQIPILTFIDTPGAYPGIDAESRNQSIAIADNLYQMSKINTPIISVVIGEGGSGGALAIGVADRLAMLQYSIYSVISPEGCASILWKDASKANIAAEELSITSGKLLGHKLIDRIIPEPHGAAHRNYAAMYSSLKSNILDMLQEVNNTSHSELLKNRYAKLMSYGQFES